MLYNIHVHVSTCFHQYLNFKNLVTTSNKKDLKNRMRLRYNNTFYFSHDLKTTSYCQNVFIYTRDIPFQKENHNMKDVLRRLASTQFVGWKHQTAVLKQSCGKWGLAVANMCFQARNVWMCTSTFVASQLLCQVSFIIVQCHFPLFAKFLHYIYRVEEKGRSE